MKLTILALLPLLVCTAALAAGDDALKPAVAAFEKGEFERVLELCAGVTDDALRPKADYLAGEANLVLGRFDAAEKSFRAVLVARPDAVPALTGLGRALTGEGRAADAVPVLEKALKEDKSDAGALRALGLAYAATGKNDEALKSLRKAWKEDKKDPLTCRAFVVVLLDAGGEKEAMSVANGLVRARKKHPMGYFLRGLVLDRRNESDDAIAAYEQALEKDDTFLDAHKNIAIICHAVNPTYQDIPRTKKAFEHYQRYFDLGGNDPELLRIYQQTKGFLESNGYLK